MLYISAQNDYRVVTTYNFSFQGSQVVLQVQVLLSCVTIKKAQSIVCSFHTFSFRASTQRSLSAPRFMSADPRLPIGWSGRQGQTVVFLAASRV